MDMNYLNFCQRGNPYYDVGVTVAEDLAAVTAPLPDGWSTRLDADWCYQQPPDLVVPDQGWKIHVSATPGSAERVLKVVWDYCTQVGMMFKFIRSQWVLLRRNGKYGDRGGSGKFITIFPTDEAALERTLRALAPALEGEQGPYILTDLRYGSGPLFVRYGGFVSRLMRTPAGELVHCITDPGGRLVPDRRKPGFRVPEWVQVPDCLQASVVARRNGTLSGFPFRATKALHFSNGGGVYEAVHTESGERVLLKEGRPLAGLDEDGKDAVERLEREHWAMHRLRDLACVPDVIDYRKGHEHYFLARQFIDGKPLVQLIHERNPVINSHSTFTAATYAAWALAVLDSVAGCLAQMHANGVVFGDVHPNNILLRSDDSICFIDFETSTELADDLPQRIGAPGFRAPETYRGPSVDLYGLGCLRISAFLPLTVSLAWGQGKLEELLASISRSFQLPDAFGDQVRTDLALPIDPTSQAPGTTVQQPWEPVSGNWIGLRDSAVRHLLTAADTRRDDRLYPGDVSQFRVVGGGLTVAAGAAGVIWALGRLGIGVPADHLQWLLERSANQTDPRPGFFDGDAGIAYVLDEAGHPSEARALLDRAVGNAAGEPGQGLYAGPAGVGLTALHLYDRSGESALWHTALAMAVLADGDTQAGQQKPPNGSVPTGLLRGGSGNALLWLRLYEASGRPEQLRRAVAAVRADLAELGWGRPYDSDRSAPAWDTPFLGVGGAGVAMVLADLLEVTQESDLVEALADITSSLDVRYTANSGLLHGRAGTMLASRYLGGDDAAMSAHAVELGLHAVAHEPGLVFLGDHGMRLSCDLATGSAGVLLALDAAIGSGTVHLPFFSDTSSAPRPAP